MAGLGLASRVQVTAWQFWRRRNAAALSHHGVRMVYDPESRRSAALILGAAFTVLLVIGAALLRLLHPAGQVGQSAILADRDSGQIYVIVDGRIHPALNLASARLIAGQSNTPKLVKADEVAKYPQGPTVGIAGAPSAMPVRSPNMSAWTVCDTAPIATPTTSAPATPIVTLISGQLALQRAKPLAQGSAILGVYDRTAWLIFDGHRAQIDAAGLPAPVKLSRALFDAIPAGEPLEHLPKGIQLVDSTTDITTCLSWEKGSTDRAATVSVLSGQGLPIPVGFDSRLVPVVKDSAADVIADQVFIGADAANVITATGAAVRADSRESLWWVSDQGVRYGIELTDSTLKALGIATSGARQAPWVLLRVLPAGPQLSRADALVQHASTAVQALPAQN